MHSHKCDLMERFNRNVKLNPRIELGLRYSPERLDIQKLICHLEFGLSKHMLPAAFGSYTRYLARFRFYKRWNTLW